VLGAFWIPAEITELQFVERADEPPTSPSPPTMRLML